MAQRGARDTKPKLALQLEIVDLVDHAVDLIRQLGARRADLAVVGEAALDSDSTTRDCGQILKPKRAQRLAASRCVSAAARRPRRRRRRR